jgi:hypothetical protein
MSTPEKQSSDEFDWEAAAASLCVFLPVGSTVFTILRWANRTHMTREVGIVIWDHMAVQPLEISTIVGRLLGYRRGRRAGVLVRGTGMDMERHVVTSLARALHGDERALAHRRL